MAGMRREWVLALLAACATERAPTPDHGSDAVLPAEPSAGAPREDPAGDVRRLLAKRLGDDAAQSIRFPDVADVAVGRLEVDTISDSWSSRDSYLFFSAVARNRTAEVTLVVCGDSESLFWTRRYWKIGPRESARPRTPDGRDVGVVWIGRAAIAREDFDRLVRKVVLLRGATGGKAPEETEERVYWDVPEPLYSVRLDSDPPIRTRECGELARVDRASLIMSLIHAEAQGWTFEEAADPEAAVDALQWNLADMRDFRLRCRIEALGCIGSAAAIPALEKLKPREEHIEEQIDTALTRIRVLQQCKGATAAPASLLDLAPPVPEPRVYYVLRAWAIEELARRFPADYRAWLHLRFEREDPDGRLQALAELHAYDPSDLTLARKARDDPDPVVRLEGAVLLRDRDLMLVLARDATVPASLRVRAADHHPDTGLLLELAREKSMPAAERVAAIEAMTGRHASREGPGRQVVGNGLLLLLDDREYSVRRAAAEGIAAVRFDEAVPELIRAMLAALTRRQGATAADIACTLGVLGAKDAIEPIDRALQGKTQSTFWYRACFGLARISAPCVMPILEREREKHRADPRARENWDESIALHKRIRRDEAESILEQGGDVSQELADRFTTDELRAFEADASLAKHRRALKRARALKEGRG